MGNESGGKSGMRGEGIREGQWGKLSFFPLSQKESPRGLSAQKYRPSTSTLTSIKSATSLIMSAQYFLGYD